MVNERWFKGGSLKIYESERSYGAPSAGNNRVQGFPCPDSDKHVVFFAWGSEDYIHAYVVRRYGIDLNVERVQEFYFEGWGGGGGAINCGEIAELAPGVGAIVLGESAWARDRVRLIKWDSTGVFIGPEHDVVQTANAAALGETFEVLGIGGYNNNRLVCMATKVSGGYTQTPPRGGIMGFASYSWDANLNLTLDAPWQQSYNFEQSGHQIIPRRIYSFGSKLYAFGDTKASTNTATQTSRACWEYDFDGTTCYFNQTATWSIQTGSGLGTTNPSFLHMEPGDSVDYNNDLVMNGFGSGAISSGGDFGFWFDDGVGVPFDNTNRVVGEDYDGNPLSGSIASSFLLTRYAAGPVDDHAVSAYGSGGPGVVHSYESGGVGNNLSAFYPALCFWKKGSTGNSIEPIAKIVFDDYLVTSGAGYATQSASSFAVDSNGAAVVAMADNVAIMCASSKHWRWSDEPDAPEEYAKNFRVFSLAYKQGLDIPELMIPRKRWAYVHDPDLDRIMKEHGVPNEERERWVKALDQWSRLRGITDEENYIQLESWVADLREANGQ